MTRRLRRPPARPPRRRPDDPFRDGETRGERVGPAFRGKTSDGLRRAGASAAARRCSRSWASTRARTASSPIRSTASSRGRRASAGRRASSPRRSWCSTAARSPSPRSRASTRSRSSSPSRAACSSAASLRARSRPRAARRSGPRSRSASRGAAAERRIASSRRPVAPLRDVPSRLFATSSREKTTPQTRSLRPSAGGRRYGRPRLREKILTLVRRDPKTRALERAVVDRGFATVLAPRPSGDGTAFERRTTPAFSTMFLALLCPSIEDDARIFDDVPGFAVSFEREDDARIFEAVPGFAVSFDSGRRPHFEAVPGSAVSFERGQRAFRGFQHYQKKRSSSLEFRIPGLTARAAAADSHRRLQLFVRRDGPGAGAVRARDVFRLAETVRRPSGDHGYVLQEDGVSNAAEISGKRSSFPFRYAFDAHLGRAEIVSIGPGIAMCFKRTPPAFQRRKNHRNRSLRALGRGRRYLGVVGKQVVDDVANGGSADAAGGLSDPALIGIFAAFLAVGAVRGAARRRRRDLRSLILALLCASRGWHTPANTLQE